MMYVLVIFLFKGGVAISPEMVEPLCEKAAVKANAELSYGRAFCLRVK